MIISVVNFYSVILVMHLSLVDSHWILIVIPIVKSDKPVWFSGFGYGGEVKENRYILSLDQNVVRDTVEWTSAGS